MAARLLSTELWRKKDNAGRIRTLGALCDLTPERQEQYLKKLSDFIELKTIFGGDDIEFEDKFLDLYIQVYKDSNIEVNNCLREIMLAHHDRYPYDLYQPYLYHPNFSLTTMKQFSLRTNDVVERGILDLCKTLSSAKERYIAGLRKKREEVAEAEAAGFRKLQIKLGVFVLGFVLFVVCYLLCPSS
ncbi:uncharacterized protein LOC110701969 [Chenopodium quinoa]|uniref:uncharacterized protein LOC110701969 n=1 Tax=Chenopodium quinoa TaxID=63459 RepID=UPI000B7782D1|nr:uncharacterized protein LOC110701969 [Chenopodium quinoa]